MSMMNHGQTTGQTQTQQSAMNPMLMMLLMSQMMGGGGNGGFGQQPGYGGMGGMNPLMMMMMMNPATAAMSNPMMYPLMFTAMNGSQGMGTQMPYPQGQYPPNANPRFIPGYPNYSYPGPYVPRV